MNQNKKPKFRKQITTIEIGICGICMEDLVPIQYIENISGENFIKTKHKCISKNNCNYEWIEE